MCAHTCICAHRRYVYSLKFALILAYKKTGETWVKTMRSICNKHFMQFTFFPKKGKEKELVNLFYGKIRKPPQNQA